MLQHEQRQTAECYAGPENEPNQIAVKELRAIDERANQQDYREDHPDDQRAKTDAFQFRWWCVAEVHLLKKHLPQRHRATERLAADERGWTQTGKQNWASCIHFYSRLSALIRGQVFSSSQCLCISVAKPLFIWLNCNARIYATMRQLSSTETCCA